MLSLRIRLNGRYTREDLHRGLRAVAAALQVGAQPATWAAGPRLGSSLCYQVTFAAGDAELHERVEIAGHIDEGRPEERGPTYGWELSLRVLTVDDFVTLRTRGGGHIVAGDSLMIDVELARPASFDTIRAALATSMPELRDESDLADVVVHNVEALGGADLGLARAWLVRARADRATAWRWPKIRALKETMGLDAPSDLPTPMSAPPKQPPTPSMRAWTYEERTALQGADAASTGPPRCPVCGGEVKTGPGSDQWHYAVWCTGCTNTDDWCWK